ncbi:MAG: EFR1 family ferrodoxin [Candidatus Acetothermia bacterium]
MKILILYFSGTGNTKFIANKIATKLERKGHHVTPTSVENFEPEEASLYDFLVFGYPIYGYDMPKFLKGYLERLSLPSSRGGAVYDTMGYNGGNSLRATAEKLIAKGFVVVGTAEFMMPGNDGLAITDWKSKTAQQVLSTDYGRSQEIREGVERLVDQIDAGVDQGIKQGEGNPPKRKFIYRLLTPATKLLFDIFERVFTGKFRADESCIGCGLCERICPADNIVVHGKEVEFGDDCYFCLRCLHQCPVEAIQITRFTEGKFRYRGPTGNYVPAPLVGEGREDSGSA